MERKTLAFSDEISEEVHEVPNEEMILDLSNLESKPLTAPQLQRTPVFTYKGEKSGGGRVPSRPSTSNRPSTRPNSRKHRSNSPTGSLENRILIKLASVLPSGETEYTAAQSGRLPESRNTLLKLNTELDDMIKDIREMNTEHGHYLTANLYDQLKDPTNTELPTINAETGHLLYDVIIAELTTQAYRKIIRINKFYRHHLVLQRNQHQREKQALLLQVEELKSQLFAQKFYQIDSSDPATHHELALHSPGNNSNPNQSNSNSNSRPNSSHNTPAISPKRPTSRERSASPLSKSKSPKAVSHSETASPSRTDAVSHGIPNSPSPTNPFTLPTAIPSVSYDDFIREHTSYAIQENAKKLEHLHLFVMKTLEQERKIATKKLATLSELLEKSQADLTAARQEIVELKKKVYTTDDERLQQEDQLIRQMNSVLTVLLEKRDLMKISSK